MLRTSTYILSYAFTLWAVAQLLDHRTLDAAVLLGAAAVFAALNAWGRE